MGNIKHGVRMSILFQQLVFSREICLQFTFQD